MMASLPSPFTIIHTFGVLPGAAKVCCDGKQAGESMEVLLEERRRGVRQQKVIHLHAKREISGSTDGHSGDATNG